MNPVNRIIKLGIAGVVAVTLAGCATHYDRKSTNTMLGAGLGAATGAVVSQGNPWYTLGGAAAGGVLGNVLTDDRDDRRGRNWNRDNRRKPPTHLPRENRRSYDRHDRHR
jgi:osmotically inducible lipoprotein OsmB